ncbi:hypothetical protein QAD02_023491 [Eretmocerus hayati]|uniref:Uncharacterized protein n=1 Tax=Eretmocerus hayati TaxID=131215 RepID=A0ACC2PW59_9HYME|nr:hypothetical protein QAD02_023491 [Eretmocerus hayati]
MSDEHNTKIPKGAPGCTEEVDTGDINMLASSCTKLHSSESSESSELVIPKTKTKSLASNCADQENLDKQLFSAIVYKPDNEGTWGGLKLIESLIKKGANVNAKDEQGKPLIIAALDISQGLLRKDVTQLLLKHGADPNAESFEGHCALSLAIINSRLMDQSLDEIFVDLLRLLLEHGARIFLDETSKSEKPIEVVLEHGTLAAVRLFFKYDLTLTNVKKSFPLHWAARNEDTSDILEFLILQKCFDIEEVDEAGYTPLHIALDIKNIDCVKILLAYKAKVNYVTDGIIDAPLCIAVKRQDIDCMRLLIQYGADVDFSENERSKPLFVAVREDFHDCAEFLLANNATLRFDDDYLTVDLFASSNSATMLRILAKHQFLRSSQKPSAKTEDESLRPSDWELEIQKMQLSFLLDITSFYEIITDEEICTSYVNNKSVIKLFESNILIRRFPIYGQVLKNCFAEARYKENMRIEAAATLCRILKFDHQVFHFISRRIIFYLDLSDLNTLRLI